MNSVKRGVLALLVVLTNAFVFTLPAGACGGGSHCSAPYTCVSDCQHVGDQRALCLSGASPCCIWLNNVNCYANICPTDSTKAFVVCSMQQVC